MFLRKGKKLYSLYKIFKNKIFLSLILFLVIFGVLAIAGLDIWFGIDDLGNILKGLVRKSSDILRVFSTDCRDYTTPMNYKFSKPNFISALYRPLQHFIFTGIHYFFGLNPYIYYIFNVFFYSLNCVLFFNFLSLFMPLSLSLFGGLMFAFYRSISWLAWICILQDPMSTFFIFLTVFLFRYFLIKNCRISLYLAGFTYLLSLLSREHYVFFSVPAFLFVFLVITNPNDSLWQKIKYSVCKSWIFFVSGFLYVLIRIWSFGFGTISRTFNNLFLRFPFLSCFFDTKSKMAIASTNNSVVNTIQTSAASDIIAPVKVIFISFWDKFINKLVSLSNPFWPWINSIFVTNTGTNIQKFLTLFLALFCLVFIFYSYRKKLKLLMFLIIAFFSLAWPGFVAYPDPRYINPIYSVVVFTLFLGIYFFYKDINQSLIKRIVLGFVLLLCMLSTFRGAKNNFNATQGMCKSTLAYRDRFVPFFAENSFSDNANFIILASPFVSDSQFVFQAFLNNLDLRLSCVLFATLAEKGTMGCRDDYKTIGVRYKAEKIYKDGKIGYHLTSLDKNDCGYWMNFSLRPLRWSREDKSYVWMDNLAVVGVWHDFSMGKFIINERLDNKVVTDITFVFDNKWIDDNTVFVTWDTVKGKYKVLN